MIATKAPNPVSGHTWFAVVLALCLAACDSDPGSNERARLYSDTEIDYFVEVAVGSEFGNSSAKVRKWLSDVRIRVNGYPTIDDVQTLDDVVHELNELVDEIEFSIVESDPNIELHITQSSEFSTLEPNYVAGNLGFFWVNWSADAIYRAQILIATDHVTQVERSHLIREELTQSLGLMNDSFSYPESIFYQNWTDVTAYAEIDRQIIRMLYHPDVRPGMDVDRVTEVLQGL